MSDPLIAKMSFRKPQITNPRSPLGLYTSDSMNMNTSTHSLPLPAALGNRSINITSSSSAYGMGSGTLDTPGTTTSEEAGDDDITSLERIRKRKSMRLSSPMTPSPPNPSHSPATSSYTPTSFYAQPQSDGSAHALPIYGSRRSLSLLSSPFMPPQTPAGFYKHTEASENRRRTPLSRKISTGSLRRDIWEEVSSSNTEAGLFKYGKTGGLRKDSSETRSLPGSKKKGSVSRSFRRGIDIIMGKPRQGVYIFIPSHICLRFQTDRTSGRQSIIILPCRLRRQIRSPTPEYGSA